MAKEFRNHTTWKERINTLDYLPAAIFSLVFSIFLVPIISAGLDEMALNFILIPIFLVILVYLIYEAIKWFNEVIPDKNSDPTADDLPSLLPGSLLILLTIIFSIITFISIAFYLYFGIRWIFIILVCYILISTIIYLRRLKCRIRPINYVVSVCQVCGNPNVINNVSKSLAKTCSKRCESIESRGVMLFLGGLLILVSLAILLIDEGEDINLGFGFGGLILLLGIFCLVADFFSYYIDSQYLREKYIHLDTNIRSK